ncbi:beta-galactosidase domain 4-containing protein, partial [Streptomyces nodosus]
ARHESRRGRSLEHRVTFALPRDGGEAWLTLRVRTAEDQPWAPKGTQVCVRRLRLRGPAARAAAMGSGAATA